jgi:hypothetical protein
MSDTKQNPYDTCEFGSLNVEPNRINAANGIEHLASFQTKYALDIDSTAWKIILEFYAGEDYEKTIDFIISFLTKAISIRAREEFDIPGVMVSYIDTRKQEFISTWRPALTARVEIEWVDGEEPDIEPAP